MMLAMFYLKLALMGSVVLATDKGTEYSDTEATLRRILHAMDRGLDFTVKEHKHINLDGVIGTRLTADQLQVLLVHIRAPGGLVVPDDIVTQIEALQRKADHVSNIAIPYVKDSQLEYYNRIGPILRPHFWTLNYDTTTTDDSLLVEPIVDDEAMRESDSDDCVAELFGTLKGTSSEKCEVSRHCWKLMTSKGYRHYSLTHQVFYMLIGEGAGCFQSTLLDYITNRNKGFCTNMLHEAHVIVNNGYPKERQDLFMEQAALCGVLGYRQFFNEDWLARILSWQRDQQGCWGLDAQQTQRYEQMEAATGRPKREERVLNDGCESHRTAVALSALTQYVRYTVEYLQLVSGSSANREG